MVLLKFIIFQLVIVDIEISKTKISPNSLAAPNVSPVCPSILLSQNLLNKIHIIITETNNTNSFFNPRNLIVTRIIVNTDSNNHSFQIHITNKYITRTCFFAFLPIKARKTTVNLAYYWCYNYYNWNSSLYSAVLTSCIFLSMSKQLQYTGISTNSTILHYFYYFIFFTFKRKETITCIP